MTEDEMEGWHHRLDGHGFVWTPGVGDGQGGLACCDSWGRKELDTTEQLNWTELKKKKKKEFCFQTAALKFCPRFQPSNSKLLYNSPESLTCQLVLWILDLLASTNAWSKSLKSFLLSPSFPPFHLSFFLPFFSLSLIIGIPWWLRW